MADRYADTPAEDRARADRFGEVFADFTPEKVAEIAPEVYAPSIHFNDTLKDIHGLDELVPYLVESAGHCEACRVELLDVARSGDDYYVRWEMMIRFKKLAKGQDTVSRGVSHLRFDEDNRMTYHQDYWDSAGGFFEYVPVLGWMIRKIKGRL